MTWHNAASVRELDDKNVIGVDVNGEQVAIFRLGAEFFATSNICTHLASLLSDGYVENGCIECPLHQALFDIRTGAVVAGPAMEPLQTFAIRVEGTRIWVDLPE